jgi:hypothetical protein
MKTTTLAALFTTLLTATASAQLAGPGLTWTGTMSGGVGSYMPSCTSSPVNAVRGESVALHVWGDQQALFALFAAGSATQCLPFPGIGNGLVLDFPLTTVTVGILTQVTPCLSCPPGLQTLNFSVPASLPPGTRLALQAASFANGNPSFTAAISASVP